MPNKSLERIFNMISSIGLKRDMKEDNKYKKVRVRILAALFILNLSGVIWCMLLPKTSSFEVQAEKIEIKENPSEIEMKSYVWMKDLNLSVLRKRNDSHRLFSYFAGVLLVLNGIFVWTIMAIQSGEIVATTNENSEQSGSPESSQARPR